MPAIQHESWFYEKFMMEAKDFRLDSAADWACLRVYDGNTLKPAMGQGFQGTPSSEQLENLYNLADQGKLVFFDLTKKTPDAVTLDGFSRIEMNPVEPTEPVKPGENASNEEKSKYALQNMKYSKLKQNYEKAVEALGKLGEGFEAAMEAYNSDRDMQAEQIENESRTANGNYVKQQRRLNNADRLIDGAFGPRPVAVGGYFHHGAANPKEFSFQYEKFDELFAPNGYDLPADSKLNAQEVATINFAMAGAGNFVENYYKQELKAGDAAAKNGAGSFQPLVTSCFSDPRIGQHYEDFGVLGAAFQLGKDMVAQYNSGNAGPLGAHLADCVRNLKATGTGASWDKFSADMVAGARLIERIQELFDKHQDIKKAANLTEKELEFMRGYVQLGKAYNNFLTGIIKTNDAAVRGEKLSIDAKTEILADAVLRNLITKDLAADKAKHDADPAFKRELDEANKKDNASSELLTQWQLENPEKKGKKEEEQYKLSISVGSHATVVSAKDLDHGIIYTLAKNGMLEKMRSELMQNPAILEAAAKEPFEFSGQDLGNSEKLDALVAQTEATKDAWKTQAWYENMKTTLMGSQPENWLNSNTPGDNNRLMVGVTVKDTNEVKLVGLDTILEGGVKALENPTQETLLILQGHAAKGNLYYYEVGKDMPIRVGAEDAWATAEQLKVPPQPTLWQIIANTITFGWAYADICNPKPDKDPAVFEAILAARESRNAVPQNEAQQSAQEHKQVEKISEQKAELDQKQSQKQEQNQKKNKKEDIIRDQMLGRKLAEYNKQTVDAAIGRFALADEKYMPAAAKNTMGLTKEEVGVLAAIACGSKELSFQDAKSGKTAHNKPDENYNRIISTHYAEGNVLGSKTLKSFHALARREVKNALESGNMEKLGKLLADGLTQNNKWLSKQTDLSDYYTVYAELGGKLLNIVEKNEQLKQAFNKHLGKNTNQINMAKAAKNISDLRVKVLPLKEQLMKDFTKYKKSHVEGVKDTPLHVSSNEEIATICQLCMIQQSMKMNQFDLATTEYAEPNMVDEANDFLKDSKQLEIFRTKSDYREVALDDVSKMATLYSGAINIKKAEMTEQKQAQIVVDKQNEKQIEQPKPGPKA